MRLLLDTHALLWSMGQSAKLSPNSQTAIAAVGNEVFVSVASIWEAGIKHRSGKLPEAAPLTNDPKRILTTLNFSALPVQLEHARLAGSLASTHKDPFDRMLAAQALLEGLTLVSRDVFFDSLLVNRLW